jgi:hypothetical protein
MRSFTEIDSFEEMKFNFGLCLFSWYARIETALLAKLAYTFIKEQHHNEL